jgi:Flp pilus assembly secretin CpaC
MTALYAYRRRRPIHELARIATLSIAMVGVPASAADLITVAVDQATITKLPERVATIVVGNPLIADITVQPGGLLVITGKGYGTTNMIALDRAGAVLAERGIQVLGPEDKVVTVYRGGARESYSCAPECEPRITLGDAPPFFNETLLQTSTRAAQAQGAASGQR